MIRNRGVGTTLGEHPRSLGPVLSSGYRGFPPLGLTRPPGGLSLCATRPLGRGSGLDAAGRAGSLRGPCRVLFWAVWADCRSRLDFAAIWDAASGSRPCCKQIPARIFCLNGKNSLTVHVRRFRLIDVRDYSLTKAFVHAVSGGIWPQLPAFLAVRVLGRTSGHPPVYDQSQNNVESNS